MHASIQAGAGTGKTTRVVGLLLDRLLRTDTEPSRLLALTFTVRAANEMRDRLGTWLSGLVGGRTVDELGGGLDLFDHPDRARPRGERALAELDRIEIGTIHSFAAHLLRQYPIEAEVSPTFVEDDGSAAARLFRERWPSWLAERLRDPAQTHIMAEFLERSELSEVRSFAAALCQEGVPLGCQADTDQARAWTARMADAAARTRALLERHAADAGGGRRRVVETLRYMLRLFESPAVTVDLRRQARLLDERWPTARSWRAGEAAYRELRQFARAIADCDDGATRAIVEWLRPFVQAFRREYSRQGLVSFQGLLVRGARLLREHLDIRDHLKKRFHLILVDEFQDTDPLQGEMLLFLAERMDRRERDSRRVEVEPGKLVIVGDEKQSIYLFRGADLEAYQAIATRLTGDRSERIERLAVNYRSRRELVAFVNALGRRIMRSPEYAAVDPAPCAPGGGRVEMMLFPDLDADGARTAEAQAISSWVAAAVRRGEFRAGDVAVLLRTLGVAEHYTAAFREQGIEFVIEGEKHFYAAQEVLDLLNLLSAIADPTDELAVTGMLRSPLGAVRDRELVDLRTAGALCPLDGDRVPAPLPHVRQLYESVARLHDRSRRIPVADLMREVTECFPVLEIARATLRGEQAVANVRKLIEALELESGTSLSAALSEYRRRFRDREEEGEAPLGEDRRDAVRILSIHKAKGLEFPVVVLADLHRERAGREKRPVLQEWLSGRVGFRCGGVCSRDWLAADERYRQIEEDETRRLLYVALTRAKDRILLTGGRPDKGLLGVIVSALESIGLPIEAGRDHTLRGEGFAVDVRFPASTEPETMASRREAVSADPDHADERRRWQAREVRGRETAETPWLRHPSEALLPGHDRVGQVDDDASRDRVQRLEQDEDIVGAVSLGSRCHAVLATMNLADPGTLVMDPPVRAILGPFFESAVFRDLQRAERLYRELPFVSQIEGVLWSGQLDVLYCLGGQWTVADYKSDRNEEPERYRAQARIYVRAAQDALGLMNPPEFRLIYLRSGRVVAL